MSFTLFGGEMFPSLLFLVLCLTQSPLYEAGIAGLTKYFRDFHRSAWHSASRQSASSSFSKNGECIQDYIARCKKGKPGIGKKVALEADHVCIDMNQILYSNVRNADNPKFVMTRLFTAIDHSLKLITPRKSLVLAFDGPAPFAKMQTQRSRRKDSSEGCLITPGTDFMKGMEPLLLCYAFQRMHRSYFQNVSVFISGPDSPGEGELKIMDWVLRNVPRNGNDSVVICGCDSDIILQSISIGTYQKHCYVLQAGSDYSDAFCEASSLYKSLVCNIFTSTASNNITSEESTSSPNTSFPFLSPINSSLVEEFSQIESTRFDVILLYILLGNDYLPKLRGISANRVLRAYADVILKQPSDRQYLVDIDRYTFNFPALLDFCLELGISKGVALPVQAPESIQTLHNILQRTKNDFNWSDIELPVKDKEGRPSVVWSGGILVQNKTYSTDEVYGSKREFRRSLAAQVIQDIDNEAYESMRRRQLETKLKLEEIRRLVREETASKGGTSEPEVGINDAEALVVQKEVQDVAEEVLDDSQFDLINDYEVSEEEYSKYVRQSDVEEYLKGLLWVLRMYRTGTCPDLSYCYTGRPSITPYLIAKYLERVRNAEGFDSLSQRIQAPNATHRYLSADANVCCVIPGSRGEYVPTRLKGVWIAMQTTFFQTMFKDSLSVTTYEELISRISEVWRSAGRNLSMEELHKNGTSSYEINQRNNQRRLNRRKRKEIGLTKHLKKLNFNTNTSLVFRDENDDGDGLFNDRNEWLVVTRQTNLTAQGYGGVATDAKVVFPLALPFPTPNELPAGVRVLRTDMSSSTPRDLDAAFRAQFDASLRRLGGDLANMAEDVAAVSDDDEPKPIRAWQRDPSAAVSPWQRRGRGKSRGESKKIVASVSSPSPLAPNSMQAPASKRHAS